MTALKQGAMIIVGGMVSSLLLFLWLQRYLPHLPYFNKLILNTTSGDVLETGANARPAIWPAIGSRGRVLVRYSGTEFLARIMLEGEEEKQIRAMAEDIAGEIRAEIGKSI